MQRLTSLPILISTLFLWTLTGTLGCDGNSGAGTGGGGDGGASTGGSSSGGASSGGGGAGGSSSGGSSSGGASTGGGGAGGSAECVGHTPMVLGCILSSALPGDPVPPIALETSGLVTAVRAPNAGEGCGPSYWYQVGYAQAPEVMIDLTLIDGSPLTIGVAAPGFAQADVSANQTLGIKFSTDMVGFGGKLALLEITREDALVVAVGESSPAGVTPTEGAVTCYSEDSLCGREERAMDVEAPDGSTVSLDGGESAQVGDLMVTNDRFVHNYDVSGGCNFGLSVEYLMSAVPAK